MLLFVGLGNPGRQYAKNRHNIGFMALEAIARRHGFATARARFQGLVSEGNIGGEKVLLLQPQTYMNESGRSVGEAARFHKIPVGDIVVFHDELDLAPAKCRIKVGGGVAGHNGLRSITAHVGNDYKRVRMGIGHPGDKALVHSYVLNDFAKSEEPWVEALCNAIADNAALLVKGDDNGLQNRLHLALEAKGFDAVKRVGEK
ncbi:aminoacyl-tRNA hydrolase [Methylocystis sp. MJC1]|jgi:PTH1 family peptidyl-tRNA hydrolase|uniref:aminoacyl-tRNA hydrolase n=1 Tax=Methylocystis sp. MJC1 TaxID=2654282 RepID=UPI0013EC7741|nr:aminoacyl-tRNA hydrolase [Methylocystis sp. MJC1]KAF2990552.1 Peptidyl-tRNA hydrolase [Methylocystis sp. MJC1]MBU6525787.1 aminoacyl-tRNA hydrolase [Methylocystis sp. MJC1]UZX12254.1 aminoacyl-tRNA hydrolase [Methylocystis sp. MJC1]